ncbi:MAG: hypothetical protein HYX94_10310 [Chloroflexi bacterium]|nr:hypothetical protein [Chloroflexota bacterium]
MPAIIHSFGGIILDVEGRVVDYPESAYQQPIAPYPSRRTVLAGAVAGLAVGSCLTLSMVSGNTPSL